MPVLDDINEKLRDYVGWDAQNPLPVGNPRTGVYSPTKRDFRELFIAFLQAQGDPAALQTLVDQLSTKANAADVMSRLTPSYDSRADAMLQASDLPASITKIVVLEGTSLVVRSRTAFADDPLYARSPHWGVLQRHNVAAETAARLAGYRDLSQRQSEAAGRIDALETDPAHQVLLTSAIRPGDAPWMYSTDYRVFDPYRLPPLSAVANGPNGKVARLIGRGTMAPRASFPLERGHSYRVRFAVQRAVDPADPSGDSLRLELAWFNRDGTIIGTSVVRAYADLRVRDGRQEYTALIGHDVSADIVIPGLAKAARPFVNSFGAAPSETHVELIEWDDVTGRSTWAPDVSEFAQRMTALESMDLGSRLQNVEQEVDTGSQQWYPSRAAAQTAFIAPSVERILVPNRSGSGLLTYVRDSAGTALVTADGARWSPLGTGYSDHFGIGQAGVVTHTAVRDFLTWQVTTGRPSIFSAGTYVFAAPATVYIPANYRGVDIRLEDGVFFQGGTAVSKLDGSIIRYQMIVNPILEDFEDRPEFNWRGGYFDMRFMKNSSSIPNATRGNVDIGTAAVTDGMSISAVVVVGGERHPAFRGGVVEGGTWFAGESWERAGGDSGLGGAGLGSITVRHNKFYGLRDQAVYLSGSKRDDILIEDNYAYGCYSAFAVKRQGEAVSFLMNHVENCVYGLTTTGLEGLLGGQKVISSGNRLIRCEIPHAHAAGTDIHASDQITEMGYAYLQDWTNEANSGVIGGRIRGVHPADQPTGCRFDGLWGGKISLSIRGKNPMITSGDTFVRGFSIRDYLQGLIARTCRNIDLDASVEGINSVGRTIGTGHEDIQLDLRVRSENVGDFDTTGMTTFQVRRLNTLSSSELIVLSPGMAPARRDIQVPASGDRQIYSDYFMGGETGTTVFGTSIYRQRTDGRGWYTLELRNGTALTKVLEVRGGERFEIFDTLFAYGGFRVDGEIRRNGTVCPSGSFLLADGRRLTYSGGLITGIAAA